jgi:UDP-3-O-[3-hydroxymyristoyl] glucosamine N-acyltransferase
MLARDLAAALDLACEGDPNLDIRAAAPLESAGPADLAFAANRKALALANDSPAGCLLVPLDYPNSQPRTLIRAADPRAAFARALHLLHPRPPMPIGIHPSAVVHPTAQIGEGTAIGPNVTIYDGVRIGARCVIHAGAVIGADGFGFVLHGDHYEKFPQVGTVEIGDDVEIGANTTIDRAALGVTRIGDGTKLDNLVHIGHNCQIGRHVVIAAQTGLAGGVIIEDYAVIGGQVGMGDKARVLSRAVIGSGAGILTSKIVRPGEPVWGTPARPLREYLKQLATVARLPEALADIRRELAELKARVTRAE